MEMFNTQSPFHATYDICVQRTYCEKFAEKELRGYSYSDCA